MKKFLLILSLFIHLHVYGQLNDKIVENEKNKFFKDNFFEDTNYPGDLSIDIIYYKLNLNISYSPNYLTGEVTVNAKSTVTALDSFFLDLSNTLTVDSVKYGNENLLFTHTENILNIQTSVTYNLNQVFSVIIYYQGVPQRTGLGSFVYDTHNGQPSIWTLSEPYGAKEWWPGKDTPADKADSADIWITCNSDFIAVSNGILIESIDNGNGTFTYKWKNRYPIANYLISLAISDFIFYQQYFKYSPVDSMPVVHYIYPEIFPDVKDQLDKTINMLEVYSEKFGLYPFIKEKYGHASFGKGGMEHQTISSMGAFDDKVMSHELAHQWFGDKITCADWRDIWLNEGFATFSEGVYTEAVSGKQAYDSFISGIMTIAKGAQGSIYVENVNSISEIFNGARSYSKGGVVLHMLRGITGDSVFFQILRNYLNDPELAYNSATTEDFQRVAEVTYGNSLEYFFREWIYGENYPHYYLKWDYKETEKNIFKIDLTIDQGNNTNPLFFTMPLQIKISTSVKDTLISIFNNQQIQTYSFKVEGEPEDFVFDPNNFVLDDAFVEDPFNLQIPRGFSLLQNYPNPFNNSTSIKFKASKRGEVIIKIFDILGNELTTIFNDDVMANEYEVNFDASVLSSGIYYYRMYAEDFIETKKMILIK